MYNILMDLMPLEPSVPTFRPQPKPNLFTFLLRNMDYIVLGVIYLIIIVGVVAIICIVRSAVRSYRLKKFINERRDIEAKSKEDASKQDESKATEQRREE